jgi:hypothetical protein
MRDASSSCFLSWTEVVILVLYTITTVILKIPMAHDVFLYNIECSKILHW